MCYSEHLDTFYGGLQRKDYSTVCNMIQNYIWESYDEERNIITNKSKFKFACQLCASAYGELKEYEDQIEYDRAELNGEHGSCLLCYNDDYGFAQVQYMMSICDMFHKYFEHFALLYDKENLTKVELPEIEEYTNEIDKSNLVSDTNPEHKILFVKILNSKIPDEVNDNDKIIREKDKILYHILERLYKELCNLGYLNSNVEDRSVFIYRFSGLNGDYPSERKLLWKGQNVFLGYIVRCLISDKRNPPMNFRTVATFFYKENGNQMNFSTAKNYLVKDFDNEKESLPRNFTKAVELLRKCGFRNVEFTSSRR